MKKKLILAISLAAVFCCLFAVAVGAQAFDKTEKVEVTLLNGSTTECALYDADGDELVWYTLDGGATLVSVKTKDLYFSDEASLRDIYLEKDGTALQMGNETSTNHIVVANLRCKYFTALVHSGYKSTFDRSTLIQYVYLPSTIKNLACNQFQSCTSLKVLDFPSDARFSFDDSNFAPGCTSLKEINLTGLTGVKGGSHFASCSSLSKIVGLENSTTTNIGRKMFEKTAITEVRLPNTATTLGEGAFNGCKSLKVAYLGNALNTFEVNSNFKASDAFNSTAIEYIYIPKSVTAVAGYTFSGANSLRVVFFTGTKAEAMAMYSASSTTNNTPFVNLGKSEEQFISYEEYSQLPLGDTGKYIVYGYSACTAFYGDNHVNSTSYGFAGEKYVSEYCRYDACERCGMGTTTSYGKLLVNKGYSIAESGDGFTYDIKFNKEVIAIYEENEGTTFSYGIVAGKITEGDGGKIVTEAGEKATDGVFTSNFTETSYELFNVKVTGVDTAEYKAKDVYLSAFLIDGEDVYYLGQEVTDAAVAISYDKIFALNTPSNDEE